jgi:competence protein ComEC
MIIATHPDQDHIGGFVEVLKRYKIEYELEPGVKSETQTSKVIHELIKKDSVKTYVARKGMKIELDDGVVITILYPDTDAYDMKTNDASIVARLTYGETEVMLTGDAPIKSEKEILAYKENIQSDILKVGHHGSKTSTSMEFVKAVNPTYAVISSGRGNRYGHPNQETLDVLAQFPVEVLRTDQMGAIVIKSDGRKFVLKK